MNQGATRREGSAWRGMGYAILRGARGLQRHPTVPLLTVGAVAVSLLLLGVVFLGVHNVGTLTRGWGGGVQMVVYLDDDVPVERAHEIANILESAPAVESVDFVSPEEAYRRLTESLGDDRVLLGGVEVGYLPASLEVRLAEGVRDLAKVSPLVDRLRNARGVEGVEFLGDWVKRVTQLLQTLRLAALGLGLLVGGACLYIVATTVKLGVVARRDELEILRLVGATDGFVRGPLLFEGTLQGALGAGAALGLLGVLWHFAVPVVERALSGALGHVNLVFFSPMQIVSAVVLGGLLGGLASWLAVGTHGRA